MAQTGYTPIQLYHSTAALATPLAADLRTGELAFNVADGKIYYKDLSNAVQLLVSAGSGGGTVTSVAGTGTVNGLTLTGTVTSTGNLTLGGTLSGVNLASQVTGNLPVANLNSGTGASSSTFWRGDGTWATPSGGGGGTITQVNANNPVAVTGATGPTPTLSLINGSGGAVTGSTGTGLMVCNTSPTLVTPVLGVPTSGDFSSGTFTWPTFNQNTTGNAATATAPAGGGSFITSSNIGSQSVSYASSAGSVTNATNAVYATYPASGGTFITSSNIGSQSVSSATTATNATNASNLTGTPNISVGTVTATGNIKTTGGNVEVAIGGGSCSLQTSNSTTASVQLGASGYGLARYSGATSIVSPGATFSFYENTNCYNAQNATTWNTTSDINVKTNIRPVTSALVKIAAITPKHYEYKDELGKTRTGFIAQEFEQVFPGHVTDTLVPEKYKEFMNGAETMKSISMELVPYLVAAIQELKAEVDALKAAK